MYTKVPNTSLLLQADDVSNNKPTYRKSNNTASVLSWKILPHVFCFFKAWMTALCRSLHVPCTTVSTCQSQFNLSQKLITFQKHLRTALHQSHYNDSCGETGCLQQNDFFLLPLWCYKIVSVLQTFLLHFDSRRYRHWQCIHNTGLYQCWQLFSISLLQYYDPGVMSSIVKLLPHITNTNISFSFFFSFTDTLAW